MSFLNNVACSGIGGAGYMIGVTELLVPGLSCSSLTSPARGKTETVYFLGGTVNIKTTCLNQLLKL